MSKLTLDEAIKHCLEVAKGKECKAKHYNRNAEREYNAEKSKYNIEKAEESLQCAADHRQLAEWLTELKELRNSIGAVKLSNMKEALELIRAYKAENIAQKKIIAEYKRLLKAAVEDMNSNNICFDINACNVCKDKQKCPCETFKWRYTDEALKLIGGSENG